jgi:hypothetical protein
MLKLPLISIKAAIGVVAMIYFSVVIDHVGTL